MNHSKKAFTLIELIVVITILTILGSIGFVTLTGYFAGARDGARLADMNSIYGQLNLTLGLDGQLPMPENSRTLLFSGATMAYQGYVGKNTLSLIKFEGAGRDPKDNAYYTYTMDSTQKLGQLMGYFEEYDTSKLSNSIAPTTTLYNATYGTYMNRRVGTIGKNICVVMESGSLAPVQATSTGNLDIVTSGTGYIVYCDSNTARYGSGLVLTRVLVINSATFGTGGTISTPVYNGFLGEDGIAWTDDDCDTNNITIGTGTATEQTWAACNLGATIAYNGTNTGTYNPNGSGTRGSTDAVNGKIYQWGRNKGFAGSDQTQQTTALLSNPNGADTYNFVSSGTLADYDWLTPQIPTIWGGVATDSATVDGQSDDILRQGPCPSGWHIPSAKEWQDACNTITSTTCTNNMGNTSVRTTLMLPPAGYRHWTTGKYSFQGGYGFYWSSSPTSTIAFYMGFGPANVYPTYSNYGRAYGLSLRCLKN